ncbi:MAG: hypothetical protein M3Z07_00275 [Candidatus Eremiobacteraeota bacterium]|nr:hypothetical protein [Candidatus Eremiobacteraeota bacterium]
MNYELIALYSQVIGALFFAVAMIFIWTKFVQPAVIAAQAASNRQIAEAERRRDEAKVALDSLQGEIGAAETDAAAIKARAGASARIEIEKATREARESGERSLRNAQGELARSRIAARERMRDEMLDAALALARGEAAARITPEVNTRLVDTFVKSLERGRN